jgi:hypothetical protein
MGSHHIGRVWKAELHDNKPWHAQCDCGTAGDFLTEGEAVTYLVTHFNRNGGICTSELLKGAPPVGPVKAAPPAPVPAAPAADTKPPVPPAPPAAKVA